jgi:3-oxo-5-alpha-steroid 4-dehydrogenase 1
MYMIHYFIRSFYYPFRIRPGAQGAPLIIVAFCFLFCGLNGLLQGVALTRVYRLPDEHLTSPWFIFGSLVYIFGLGVNQQADSLLRNLRKPGEIGTFNADAFQRCSLSCHGSWLCLAGLLPGYKIPVGGMFEYVSGANYFGEIVEVLSLLCV